MVPTLFMVIIENPLAYNLSEMCGEDGMAEMAAALSVALFGKESVSVVFIFYSASAASFLPHHTPKMQPAVLSATYKAHSA